MSYGPNFPDIFHSARCGASSKIPARPSSEASGVK
jgi:hypothetical protein